MYFIYRRDLETGKEEYLTAYDNTDAAIAKITNCYLVDAKLSIFEGRYYYYMTQH